MCFFFLHVLTTPMTNWAQIFRLVILCLCLDTPCRWKEATIVFKCPFQGYKCHDQDSNQHSPMTQPPKRELCALDYAQKLPSKILKYAPFLFCFNIGRLLPMSLYKHIEISKTLIGPISTIFDVITNFDVAKIRHATLQRTKRQK